MSDNTRRASFWFTALSSTSRIRSGCRDACSGSSSEKPGAVEVGRHRLSRCACNKREVERAAAAWDALALGPHRSSH